MQIRAINDNIICTNADFGDQVTSAGLIIKSNLEKSQGITPRWFRVFEVGPDIQGLLPGEWVLVEYGRWTEAFELSDDRTDSPTRFWKVDPKACLATSDEKPQTFYYNSSVEPSVYRSR
jgi:hypothetical protein